MFRIHFHFHQILYNYSIYNGFSRWKYIISPPLYFHLFGSFGAFKPQKETNQPLRKRHFSLNYLSFQQKSGSKVEVK